MTVQIAHLYAMATVAIAFFQIALIAGAPLGRYTQGGQHDGALPMSGRIIAVVSIPVVLFQGLAILSAAGFPGLDWPAWTEWLAFGVQIVSTVLNWITPSKSERMVWGPVMLVMSAMALVVLTA
jgi:cytochrome bd-type quinol oxidase subunit 2